MKTKIVYPGRFTRTVQNYSRLVQTFSNWPDYLAAKWGWIRTSVLLMETRAGLRVEVPLELRVVFKDIFLYQTYCHPAILAGLPEKPVIIDVGGNVGFFSLFAFHLRPQAQCWTFEPLKVNFAQLQRNQTLNPRLDWHLCRAAVAGNEGLVRLCASGTDGFSTEASLQRLRGTAAASSALTEEVEAQTLPAFLARQNLKRCDWLKLDCEGAEYEILYSLPAAMFDRFPMLSVETHPMDTARNNTDALADYLEQVGYNIWLADDGVIHALK